MQLFAEKIERVALAIGDSELAQQRLLGTARALRAPSAVSITETEAI